MSYEFAGFFAKPTVAVPTELPSGAVWRDVEEPFAGVGVLISTLGAYTPNAQKIEALARQLGLSAAASWLFLIYSCWAGEIDLVYGLGQCDGVVFGPIDDSSDETVEASFLELMEQFGVPRESALRFKPFERGYWEEI